MTDKILNILLIEDSPLAVKLIHDLLDHDIDNDGYKIFHIEKVSEVDNAIDNQDYDVILLDLGLPDSQGIQTFFYVYEKCSLIPIVILSSNEDEQLALRSVKEGAQDYLIKGQVTSHFLVRTLRYAIERFGMKKQLMNLVEELKEHSKRLELSNATKDKFFSIIAHDLRSPFQNIVGISTLFSQEIEQLDRNTIKELSRELKNTVDNYINLQENLLNWAIMQLGKMQFAPERFLSRAKADEVIGYLSAYILNKDITVINNINAAAELYADANMIRAILLNLISNAIKFSMNRGKIEILMDETKDSIQITVKDNGVGMSETQIKNLFNLGIRTSTFGTEMEKGTGLGLILIKEMIEAHGGNISVQSRLGVGSEFSFSIPNKTDL